MGCLLPQTLFIRFVRNWDVETTNVCCEEGMWLAFDLNIRLGGSRFGVRGVGTVVVSCW
jgi:hypothetical protein